MCLELSLSDGILSLFDLPLVKSRLLELYSSEFISNVLLCVDVVSFLHMEKHLFIS